MSATRTRDDRLTDRYVHAATRRLDEEQRADVALELRADIADRVDALLARNPELTPAQAERAALVELGDPDRLAASYRGVRQQLIGPELFPSYVQVLKAVTFTAVPITVAVVAVIDSFTGETALDVLGRAVWMGLSLTVHVAFWVTLAFAVVERSGGDVPRVTATEPWTPEQLPDLPQAPRGALGETVATLTWLGVLAGFVVWQHVAWPAWADGERVPVLDPDLWSSWLPLVVVALLLEAGFEVVKYRAGGVWTPRFAALNTVTGLLFAAPLAWLAWQEKLLNPAFVSHVREGWSEFDPGAAHTVVLVSAVVVWLWDTVDGWRRTLA